MKTHILALLDQKLAIQDQIKVLQAEGTKLLVKYPIFNDIGLSPLAFPDTDAGKEFAVINDKAQELYAAVSRINGMIAEILGDKIIRLPDGRFMGAQKRYSIDDEDDESEDFRFVYFEEMT